MKTFLITRIVPVFITLIVLFLFGAQWNSLLFKEEKVIIPKETATYISNFRDNSSFYQSLFLNNKQDKIFLFGSSELTSSSVFLPSTFLTENCALPTLAIGHAGNQSFSIYCQLLAKYSSLENTKAVLIVSPSWFIRDASDGTHPQVFFEFLTPELERNLTQNALENNNTYFDYARSGMNNYLSKISNTSIEYQHFVLNNPNEKNVFHQLGSKLLFPFYSSLINAKHSIYSTKNTRSSEIKVKNKSEKVNWEELQTIALQKFELASSNNSMGIDSVYYNQYVNGAEGKIKLSSEKNNQEYRDFMMLLQLMKHKKMNVSFVIMPLNPNYYSNLKELDPLVNIINSEIISRNFPILNLWESHKNKYKKGTLNDIMHFGDYGWMLMNEFIFKTYSK